MKSSESNLERMSSIGLCTGLANALGMDYKAEESRLFLDSSIRSMKAVPLLIGNTVLRFPLLIQDPKRKLLYLCFTFSSFPHMFCNNCEVQTTYLIIELYSKTSMVTFRHKNVLLA